MKYVAIGFEDDSEAEKFLAAVQESGIVNTLDNEEGLIFVVDYVEEFER